MKMYRHKFFLLNFYNFYRDFSQEQIEDLISKMKNILDHHENIEDMGMVLLEKHDSDGYAEFHKKKLTLIKSVVYFVLTNYGIMLDIKSVAENPLYINAPIVPLEEINETFKIDPQEIDNTLLE